MPKLNLSLLCLSLLLLPEKWKGLLVPDPRPLICPLLGTLPLLAHLLKACFWQAPLTQTLLWEVTVSQSSGLNFCWAQITGTWGPLAVNSNNLVLCWIKPWALNSWVILVIQTPVIPPRNIFKQSGFSLSLNFLSCEMGIKEPSSQATAMKKRWDGAVDPYPTQPCKVSKKLNLITSLCIPLPCARRLFALLHKETYCSNYRKKNPPHL